MIFVYTTILDPHSSDFEKIFFEFVKSGSTLILRLKAPFTNKDNFEINRYGDNLAIKVLGATGYIVNVIPLPVATITMKLFEVKIHDGIIEVTFKE